MHLNCPKCKADIEVHPEIKNGMKYSTCPECGSTLTTKRKVDPSEYVTLPHGQIRRKRPKGNLTKTEKKRRIREKNQRREK